MIEVAKEDLERELAIVDAEEKARAKQYRKNNRGQKPKSNENKQVEAPSVNINSSFVEVDETSSGLIREEVA